MMMTRYYLQYHSMCLLRIYSEDVFLLRLLYHLKSGTNKIRANMEQLMTLKPGNKTGIRMRVVAYEAIRDEILKLIRNQEGLTVQTFFEILHPRLTDDLGSDAGWYLYHVKLDLEVRGVIRVVRIKQQRNMVRTILKMVRKTQFRA